MSERAMLRVMLIEDSALLVRELSATLEEVSACEVVAVADGEGEALRQLRSARAEPIDALVVDVFLNEGSGLRVVRSAKALRPALHVVVLSNYATLEVRKAAVGLGVDRVFDKTRQLDDFLDHMARLAGARDADDAADLDADTRPMRNG
jgi:two-component system, OmpR family, response regulator